MDRIEVRLVHWPTQACELDAAAAADIPRLLLVEPDVPPPEVTDELEDWIRLPADPIDMQARITNLRDAARRRGSRPRLDEDGILRRDDRWVALRPADAVLLGALLERAGRVVRTEALTARAWPQGPPSKMAVHDRLRRLTAEIAPLGLRMHRVRATGYLLEVSAPRV